MEKVSTSLLSDSRKIRKQPKRQKQQSLKIRTDDNFECYLDSNEKARYVSENENLSFNTNEKAQIKLELFSEVKSKLGINLGNKNYDSVQYRKDLLQLRKDGELQILLRSVMKTTKFKLKLSQDNMRRLSRSLLNWIQKDINEGILDPSQSTQGLQSTVGHPPLIQPKYEQEFEEKLIEIINNLKSRNFDSFRDSILPIIKEFREREKEQFNDKSFSVRYWSNYRKKHPRINKLWKKLPFREKQFQICSPFETPQPKSYLRKLRSLPKIIDLSQYEEVDYGNNANINKLIINEGEQEREEGDAYNSFF